VMADAGNIRRKRRSMYARVGDITQVVDSLTKAAMERKGSRLCIRIICWKVELSVLLVFFCLSCLADRF
jgi:hypothetical protein